NNKITNYKTARDVPAEQGTSMLSPHLHFGEITPRQIWHELLANSSPQRKQGKHDDEPSTKRKRAATDVIPVHAKAKKEAHISDAGHYLREIGWREFAQHLLYHFPQTPEQPLREKYRDFPWRDGKAAARDLRAWQRGQTGYPIVDAAMRELWLTGTMHNRARMIAASFLIKHLLIDWRRGEEWFWDTLLDADLANNAASWQWVAGSGADASPYFRIFNPVTQAERYDADGAYVRHWVPELARLPDDVLHRPWEADAVTLKAAGVELGRTYPRPLVDHAAARARALEAFASLKSET
ncbi:MAG TPA: FAD-binding domain-containing protein, partial [Verrucomicrobiae bacterium]|nr:FAD-binding domain-containing protein [Verrucomicrobiae bacterium]